MEQQLAAGLTERQVAEFVDDDKIVTQQFFGQSASSTGGLFLLQLIDQVDAIKGTMTDTQITDAVAASRNAPIKRGGSSVSTICS